MYAFIHITTELLAQNLGYKSGMLVIELLLLPYAYHISQRLIITNNIAIKSLQLYACMIILTHLFVGPTTAATSTTMEPLTHQDLLPDGNLGG